MPSNRISLNTKCRSDFSITVNTPFGLHCSICFFCISTSWSNVSVDACCRKNSTDFAAFVDPCPDGKYSTKKTSLPFRGVRRSGSSYHQIVAPWVSELLLHISTHSRTRPELFVLYERSQAKDEYSLRPPSACVNKAGWNPAVQCMCLVERIRCMAGKQQRWFHFSPFSIWAGKLPLSRASPRSCISQTILLSHNSNNTSSLKISVSRPKKYVR